MPDQPKMPTRSPKQKPRTIYHGMPLRREGPNIVDAAAEMTPGQIAKLKADFIASLNAWANRRAKPGI